MKREADFETGIVLSFDCCS